MTAVCQFHHPARGIGFGVVRGAQLYDASDLWPGMAAFLRWSVGRANRATQLAALLAGRAPRAARWSTCRRKGGESAWPTRFGRTRYKMRDSTR